MVLGSRKDHEQLTADSLQLTAHNIENGDHGDATRVMSLNRRNRSASSSLPRNGELSWNRAGLWDLPPQGIDFCIWFPYTDG
jgi:hypothetical protein